MGRFAPVSQEMQEKIVEILKNGVPQRRKKSVGISVHKGERWKPTLNTRDPSRSDITVIRKQLI